MLETYIREFVAIGNFLLKYGTVKKGYILIEKSELETMLNKNKYDTSANKLKIWKNLRWIDTEADRRVTKRVYEDGQYRPFIKIDISILDQLNKLLIR